MLRSIGADAPVVEELATFLAFFLALGVLTVVVLALLDAAAERVRRGLVLRRRFGKRLRSRPAVEQDTQELTLEDTQELTPVRRPRRKIWR